MRHRPARTRSLLVYAATLALSANACRCEDDSPTRKAEMHSRRAAEGTPDNEGMELPKPTGTPLAGDALLAALPLSLGEAAAEGEPLVQATPLSNGGAVPVARRTYRLGEKSIQVQVSDTLHAPAFKSMLDKQEGKAEDGKSSSWKGITLGGVQGVAMHFKRTDTALMRAMLDDRILLSVQVQPADSPDVAVEYAQKLPLAELVKLVPTQTAPAPTVP